MEPDQFLWLQHTNFCPSREPFGQILGNDEGMFIATGIETHTSFCFGI